MREKVKGIRAFCLVMVNRAKEVKIEDKIAEAKEGEYGEGEKEKGDKNVWRAYHQDGEVRYEGGKIIYRDKESGKIVYALGLDICGNSCIIKYKCKTRSLRGVENVVKITAIF